MSILEQLRKTSKVKREDLIPFVYKN